MLVSGRVTTIGDTPIFHFHDYGRVCPKKSVANVWQFLDITGAIPQHNYHQLLPPKKIVRSGRFTFQVTFNVGSVEILRGFPQNNSGLFWSNYSDLTRPHPKR